MSALHIAEGGRRELANQIGEMLLYGTFALLLFGPLAFGAVEPWSIFVGEAGCATLLFLWLLKQVLQGEIRIRRNVLFLPMALFGALIVCQLVFRITAYPHDTIACALLYLSYGGLCFLASQTVLRASQARPLAVIFSAYGAVVAGFALLQSISSNGKLYWLRQPRMGGWIYGPYVNHNHYAGLMEMLVPIPLILSLSHFASAKSRNLAATAAALMVGTIFLSGSRGGMCAILLELAIVAALVMNRKRGLRAAVGISLFVAIVAGMLIWIGGNELSRRIASAAPGSEMASDIRSSINRDGVRMFLKKPVLGWGLGTFPVVYPQFRSFYTDLFVNEAHNDYLQLLTEMGLLGFGLMVYFLALVFTNAWKKIPGWSSDVGSAATLACLLGLTGILVHSAVDFNLQVPANAALFYVLCTIAASEPLIRPTRKLRSIRTTPKEEMVASPDLLEQPATNF